MWMAPVAFLDALSRCVAAEIRLAHIPIFHIYRDTQVPPTREGQGIVPSYRGERQGVPSYRGESLLTAIRVSTLLPRLLLLPGTGLPSQPMSVATRQVLGMSSATAMITRLFCSLPSYWLLEVFLNLRLVTRLSK